MMDNSLAQILGMMPLGSGMYGLDQVPDIGGLSTIPGLGQMDLAPATMPGQEASTKIPGNNTPEVNYEKSRQAGSTASGKTAGGDAMGGGNAALGLEAMKLLTTLGTPERMQSAPAPGIAPRATQIQLGTPQNAGMLDPATAMKMSQLMYGGR